eukprot:1186994-Prorocentrum_minimum.AAC.1
MELVQGEAPETSGLAAVLGVLGVSGAPTGFSLSGSASSLSDVFVAFCLADPDVVAAFLRSPAPACAGFVVLRDLSKDLGVVSDT